MNRNFRKCGLLMVMLILGFVGYALAGDMTVVGTIGEDKTITDEAGTVYQISESEKSEEVVMMNGKKVEVMGMVEEATDGSKTIVIESYKVME